MFFKTFTKELPIVGEIWTLQQSSLKVIILEVNKRDVLFKRVEDKYKDTFNERIGDFIKYYIKFEYDQNIS